MLWFGDERGYNATHEHGVHMGYRLWFGDERGYNATRFLCLTRLEGCGLVMKEDITQPLRGKALRFFSCGLVMKEDITQQPSTSR